MDERRGGEEEERKVSKEKEDKSEMPNKLYSVFFLCPIPLP